MSMRVRTAAFMAMTVALAAPASSQAQVEACRAEHYREFDFWIGEWDVDNLRLDDEGTWNHAGSATDRVFPVAGGCGIVELWDGYVGDRHLRGFSVRTYDSTTGTWHLVLNWPQPDRARFSSLEGGFRHGRGDFFTDVTDEEDVEHRIRYSFADIGHDTFRWNDGRSTDGGQSWRTTWIMEFRLRDPMANPLFSVPLYATHETPQCSSAEYEAASFLIGTWESTGPEGSRYRVEGTPILDGCAVMEFISGDNGTNAFTVIGYEAAGDRWTMYHLDGGDGFDVYHGEVSDGEIVLRDEDGVERSRLIPGTGDSLTRVVGGTPIEFERR